MHDDIPADGEPAAAPSSRRRFLPRARHLRRLWLLRRLAGPVVLAGSVFALVTAAAGSDSHDVATATPITYAEECDNEGCSSEEVQELWRIFNEECFGEGCWMEEVGENAGSAIYYDPNAQKWFYGNQGAVTRMLDYFARLGYWWAPTVYARPGPTGS